MMLRSRCHPRSWQEVSSAGIVRTRAFLLLVGGMSSSTLPKSCAACADRAGGDGRQCSDQLATWMVSFYAMGVIGGRAVFGIALDRIGAHIVAFSALLLPTLGFILLANPGVTAWIMAGGVLIIGVAQGAEGDVGAYMVSRHFSQKNYSLIFGFVKAASGRWRSDRLAAA